MRYEITGVNALGVMLAIGAGDIAQVMWEVRAMRMLGYRPRVWFAGRLVTAIGG